MFFSAGCPQRSAGLRKMQACHRAGMLLDIKFTARGQGQEHEGQEHEGQDLH